MAPNNSIYHRNLSLAEINFPVLLYVSRTISVFPIHFQLQYQCNYKLPLYKLEHIRQLQSAFSCSRYSKNCFQLLLYREMGVETNRCPACAGWNKVEHKGWRVRRGEWAREGRKEGRLSLDSWQPSASRVQGRTTSPCFLSSASLCCSLSRGDRALKAYGIRKFARKIDWFITSMNCALRGSRLKVPLRGSSLPKGGPLEGAPVAILIPTSPPSPPTFRVSFFCANSAPRVLSPA